MTDFSAFYLVQWRDGDPPKATGTVVSHDTRNHCYDIPEEDEEAFLEWVACNWGSDFCFYGEIDGEKPSEFLNRAGIQVRFA